MNYNSVNIGYYDDGHVLLVILSNYVIQCTNQFNDLIKMMIMSASLS